MARLLAEPIVCDWCESRVDFETLKEARESGWFSIEGDSESWDFCCWDCLISYL